MPKTLRIACLMFLPMFAGCTVQSALFSIFGHYYTGGGYTRAEKEYDYKQHVEASRNYRDYSDRNRSYSDWNP